MSGTVIERPSAKMKRAPLEYAGGSPLRLPPSELGSLSLVLTAIWVSCVGITLAAAAFEAYVAFALLVLTAMAMMVFVPIGLFASLLALAERD